MKKRIAILAVSLVAVVLLWGLVFYQNYKFNSTTHVLEFDESLSREMEDENTAIRIVPRGYHTNEMASWYHTMADTGKYNGSYVGTIYEVTLKNLTEDVISDWGFELHFPCDTMFAEGWNGDFAMHQYVDEEEKEYVFEKSKFVEDGLTLDHLVNQSVLLIPFHKGDYFTYTPSEDSLEVPLNGSDLRHQEFVDKTIGFIVYTKDVGINYNMGFCEGRLTYQLQRSILGEPLFYATFVLSMIWIIALVVVIVVHIKRVRLEKEKQMMEEMIHVFEKDDSTNIFSRRAFLHYGQDLIDKKGNKLGIAIVDIDQYVLMQHKLGEIICAQYTNYLADYYRAQFPDGCVGRFSRGKIAVLFPINENKEIDIDVFIGQVVKDASPMPDQKLKVGIYAPIDAQYKIERCCDRVLMALDQIKEEYEQNVAYFDETLEHNILDKHTITAYMEEALSQNQFQVYYQPKNDAKTKEVAGAEALVRWIHPEFGFMNPGQFIPIFEEQGFITRLDEYVFEQVCRDLKRWKNEGRKLVPISVNISRRDFYEKEWMEKRIAYANGLGIDPALLHMEITESLYSEDTELIQTKVKSLRELGYLVELDDFGSGYSSLGLLGSLSIDILKLDITFVRNIDISGVVVASVIDMAHKLKLKTIAEGVETEEQYAIIRDIGCDYIQGYFFSKPLDRESFEKYLSK